MFTLKSILGFVAVLFMSYIMTVPTLAQDEGQFKPRSFPQENVKSYSYRSKLMDRVYDISISFPVGYDENSDKLYPALIVTDGNRAFPQAHGASSALVGVIDQPIIISIGAPFEERGMAYAKRRVYEFSPPNWAIEDPFGIVVKSLCDTEGLTPEECVGGAPRFLDFIVAELLPGLMKDHSIDPDDLGLFGVSAGGFFASWVIFQENSPFTKYIISSPAMAYGDEVVFRLEEEYAKTHKDLDVKIYMASGTLEMDDPFLEGIGLIVSGHMHFGGILNYRNYPNLTFISEIHQGLGHVDVVPNTLARGLRLLYAKEKN